MGLCYEMILWLGWLCALPLLNVFACCCCFFFGFWRLPYMVVSHMSRQDDDDNHRLRYRKIHNKMYKKQK